MAHKISRAKYKKIFASLNYGVTMEGPYQDLVEDAQKKGQLILFDLDDDYGDCGAQLLTKALGSGSHVVFLTKRLAVAGEFKKSLRNPHHHIMIKPLELSYLEYLIHENQKEKEAKISSKML